MERRSFLQWILGAVGLGVAGVPKKTEFDIIISGCSNDEYNGLYSVDRRKGYCVINTPAPVLSMCVIDDRMVIATSKGSYVMDEPDSSNKIRWSKIG